MRILHITNVDAAGGTNTNCLQFVKAAAAANALLVLDKPGEMQARWRQAGLGVRYLGILNGPRSKFVRVLKEAAGSGRFDLVLLWCCIRVPLIRYALRKGGIRLGIHLGNPKAGGRWNEYLLRAQHFVFRSGVTTKLFSCSNHVRISHLRGFLSRFENQVIYNPVEIPEPGQTRRPSATQSGFLVGMVARMDRIKDFPTLLRAIALVRARGLRVTVELLGDGPVRAEVDQLIRELNLGSAVRLPGYVANVFEYLMDWNLFIYSTTAHEGLGNAVVEAIAAGVPCVASDLPMMREIDDGKGLIVFFRAGDPSDLADKIMESLHDSELRERVAALGRRQVAARHDPGVYSQKVIDYLTS